MQFFFLPDLAELSVLCRWFAFEGMLYVRQGSGRNVPRYLPAHLLVTQIRLLGWAATALEVTGLRWSAAPAALHRDSWQLGCVPPHRELRNNGILL